MGGCASAPKQPVEVPSQVAAQAIADYTTTASLFRILRAGDVALLRATWLVDRQKQKIPLPRRQDLPQNAIWSVSEVEKACDDCLTCMRTDPRLQMAAASIPIVVVSYCWLTPQHPDPECWQLELIAEFLHRCLELYSRVFQLSEVGVFFDWCSLYQNPRSPSEQIAFKSAMAQMNLWYASRLTCKWLITTLPEGATRPAYDESGWPSFEKEVSGLITPGMRRLDARFLKPGEHHAYGTVSQACAADRRPPALPDQFAASLATKTVTNGKDKEFLATKYRETFESVLGGTDEMLFNGLQWGDDDAISLANVLPYAKSVECIKLTGNKIGDRGVAALCDYLPVCSTLQTLNLAENCFGEAGAESLARMLPSMPRLTSLGVASCPLGDNGARHLAQALPSSSLEHLELGDCSVGDAGAEHMANTLALGCPLRNLEMGGNLITDAGAGMLAEVMSRATQLQFLALHDMSISPEAKHSLRSAWAVSRKPLKSMFNGQMLPTPYYG